MKKFFFPLFGLLLTFSTCGGSDSNDASSSSGGGDPMSYTKTEPPKEDDGKGVGAITSVALNDPLNTDMVGSGKGIYEMKCAACHKLTDQRVVGPGWKGVTSKRKPEWIMNMILNVDVMLEEDPTAQKLLEECLTRMPNQNMTEKEARDILEFMYANDAGSVN
ncbi:MAG: cytochrome c [Saprospiraceae bacterium]